MDKIVPSALATAVAVLIALGATEHLDIYQKSAGIWFVLAASLLSTYLMLPVSPLAITFVRALSLIGGGFCWLEGATALLDRFHGPHWLIVAALSAFLVSAAYGLREAQLVRDALNQEAD